jgi:hypothetical protein
LVCVSLLFPIASGFFLYQFKAKAGDHHEKHLKERYGALYEEYNFGSWWQYMHASFFAVRRLLFIMILVYLREMPSY